MKKHMLLIFFMTSLSCIAQNIGIINYSTQKGLASNTCYILSQDERGKIWLGSDNGLNSFDGRQFEIYNEKNGLKNLEILSSKSLGKDRIFLIDLTNKGFILHQRKIHPLPENIQFSARCFLYNNFIYLFNNGKLKLLDLQSYRPHTSYELDYDLISDSYEPQILYEKNNKYYLFDFQNNTNTELFLIPNNHTINLANSIVSKQMLYCFDVNYLAIYKIENNQLTLMDKKSLMNNDNNYRYKLDEEGNIWSMDPKGGLFYCDNTQIPSKSLNFKELNSFSDTRINDVLVDQNQNVWVSTNDKGLYFIQNTRLQQILKFPFTNYSNDIQNMAFFEGKTYFSVFNELYIINQNNEIRAIPLNINNEEIRLIKPIGNKLFIISNNTLGYIQNEQYHLVPIKLSALKNIVPFQNEYLLSNYKGLYILQLKPLSTEKIFNQRNYSSLPYSEDSIFIGTPNGILKMSLSTRESKPFLANYLENYFITDLISIQPNTYACSTNANGLYIFNSGGLIAHINGKKGLSNNNVKSLKINDKCLYALTYDGLNKIPLEKIGSIIEKFNIRDGLPSNNINALIFRKDTIMIGTDRGFFISSDTPFQGMKQPPIFIDEVNIDGNAYYDVAEIPPLYSDQSLQIKLIYPDYASLGNISFKYKLEGYDKNWIETRSNEIIYNNIPPGNYTLSVIGINSKNESSPTIFEFPIEVKYTFFERPAVQIILVLVILLVLFWLVYRMIKRRIARRTENEKQLSQLELKAMKAQLNPHFISNCLNSISFLMHKGEIKNASQYIEIFSKMIRQNLEYSNQPSVTIQKEIDYLKNYIEMEKLRFDNKFECDIKVSSKSCLNQKIPTFYVQPFIENAIKHAFEDDAVRGKILIEFNCISPDHTQIVVMDNGKGIKENSDFNKDESYGISLVFNRADNFNTLHKTKIKYEYGNGYNSEMKGAYFMINIYHHD